MAKVCSMSYEDGERVAEICALEPGMYSAMIQGVECRVSITAQHVKGHKFFICSVWFDGISVVMPHHVVEYIKLIMFVTIRTPFVAATTINRNQIWVAYVLGGQNGNCK